MPSLDDKTVVVAGGTGNVAAFVVSALLQRGATVAVPSRSEEKLVDLQAFLTQRNQEADLDRLKTLVGDLSDENGAKELRRRINEEAGTPNAVLASLGQWRSAPSLLSASATDLEAVLQGYLIAHFKVARTFLPDLKAAGGSYVFVNGPLAFNIWPGSAFVSMATAAQHMLFRVLAQELEDSPVQVVELVTHAFIRNRQTQPGSPIPGEAVGAYAAYLLSGAGNAHGQSLQLRSLEQLEQVGIDLSAASPSRL
jgi:NAD(P)-dependent dehydrogenase (short-subunit alcohol dehydrogenase family)